MVTEPYQISPIANTVMTIPMVAAIFNTSATLAMIRAINSISTPMMGPRTNTEITAASGQGQWC